MLLAGFIWRKALATLLAGVVFALVYQTSTHDSKVAVEADIKSTDPAQTGQPATFLATAYCMGELTAAGIQVRAGMVAADPTVLPLGSVIQIDRIAPRYKGIYSVLDTGPAIQGHRLDIYMWSCDEALEFGRRDVVVTVLRRGWVEGDTRR